jgi:hypothetical protein
MNCYWVRFISENDKQLKDNFDVKIEFWTDMGEQSLQLCVADTDAQEFEKNLTGSLFVEQWALLRQRSEV